MLCEMFAEQVFDSIIIKLLSKTYKNLNLNSQWVWKMVSMLTADWVEPDDKWMMVTILR